MPERTTITQVVQLGLEVTPGTAVAANKKLPSFTLSAGPDGTFTPVTPSGSKFDTSSVLGKEWTAGRISGPPSYDELAFILHSALKKVTPTQQAATTAYLHNFDYSNTAEDTVATYTIEQGSSVRAAEFAYGMFNGVTLKGNRDSVEMTADVIGLEYTDGITLTGAPTTIDQIPIKPKHFNVYADTTAGGIGGTKLTRVMSWEWSITNRFAPGWFIDSSKGSWVVHIETKPTAKLKLKLAADSNGMTYLTRARSSTTTFFRIEAADTLLAGTAIPYKLTIDAAAQVSALPRELTDQDGVFAVEWDFNIVNDATLGPGSVKLINKLTTLS